jgi:hypothetical protein
MLEELIQICLMNFFFKFQIFFKCTNIIDKWHNFIGPLFQELFQNINYIKSILKLTISTTK